MFFYCFATALSAQDGLEIIKQTQELYNKTTNLKDKATLAADLSWYYVLYISVDSAEKYGNISLEIAKKLNNDTLIAQAYNDLANVYIYKGDFNKSIKYCNIAKKIRLEQNNEEGVASLDFKIGSNYSRLSQYDSSVYFLLKSLSYYEKVKNENITNNIYSNLSANYHSQGNYKKALEYINRPLKYFEETEDYLKLSNTLINLSGINLEIKDTIGALHTLKKAEDYAITSNNKVGLATIYNNYASIYINYNQYDSSLYYVKKSIDLREQLGTQSDLESSNLTYVISLFNLGKINEALPKALLLEKNLEKIGYNDKLVQVYQLLAYMYAYKNNTDSLLYYNKKYNQLFSQIENDNLNKTAQELETIYQTEKKEKEILEQKAKIAEQKAYIIIFISVILFFLLFALFIYNYLHQKNKQLTQENKLKDALQKIETQNKLQEQRLQISRDLHDNIGAQLTFIISSIDNLKYALKENNPVLEEKLSNISNFTKDTIIELRDTIWAMNKEEISIEDLNSRISNFIDNAKLSLNGIDFNFIYTHNEYKIQPFTSKNGINLYRIIQEAVNNAIKHAKATKILVEVILFENKAEIAIKDNGIGITENAENTGNGLSTMKKRAEEINAEFALKKLEKGTFVSLIIKK